ncbi:MAG TPA: tetratricopeptide repeat protein [Steroidobacteraceae bacterium]|nr:tetratricopeptide repeat protein [Steroidobacteraceae bacterium]
MSAKPSKRNATAREAANREEPPPRPPAARAWLAAGLVAALGLGAVIWYFGTLRDLPSGMNGTAPVVPAASEVSPEFVGSQACAGCHAAEYEAWQGSHHQLAMQPAGEASVLGDFADASFEHFGVQTRFFRDDGRFMVNTEGPDGQTADFQVQHTFGVYPLQQYLIELPGGHLQALTIAWDSRPADQGGQRWFSLYPDERIGHDDELHWTGRQQNWNYMCADCHSTDLQKNYDADANSYATTWSEISVGCEACHGPGSVHVELATRAAKAGLRPAQSGLTVMLDERRGVSWSIDPTTGNATRSQSRSSERELAVCGQCHSRRGQFSNEYRAGEPLTDHYLPALLTDGLYYPDGQQRDEVYKWGSFLSSRMYAQGVTCSDCHDPHTQQLRADGNTICAQCHLASKYDSPKHHFHAAGTAGAACTACHMKSETYMVVDPRHDHSFRIPRPDLAAQLGTPDACTGCHADRTGEWAAAEIRSRYPQPKTGFQDFAEAFSLADRDDPRAAYPLLQVAANPAESAIARASALSRIARRPTREGMAVAMSALKDPSPLVRRAALEVIEQLAPLDRRSALPLLADPSRIVRLQAAHVLAPLAADAIGEDHREAFERASAEYVAAERFNADRPENRSNLGGYLLLRGDYGGAEAEYRAALALDARYVPAWVNLADLKRNEQLEAEAEAVLREGLQLLPGDPALHHALGLSLVRQQRPEEAIVELREAAEQAPDNTRFAYVYAVGLHSQGARTRAITVLEQALERAPNDIELLSALASFHAEGGELARARAYAEQLRDLLPGDPGVEELLRSLGPPVD